MIRVVKRRDFASAKKSTDLTAGASGCVVSRAAYSN